jgi:calcium/calmodulin-dependent protein kinase I
MEKQTDGSYSKAVMKDLSGTKGFMAPELKKSGSLVGPEIDMWSFGVVFYQLCVAYLPTAVRGYRYDSGPIPFRARDWRHLDEQGSIAQDLILKCLNLDPTQRISATEALNHGFFKN